MGLLSFFHVCHWLGPNDSISPTDFGETPVSVLSRETWNRLAFFVWEVPFGGKFGDDVGWPKTASQVASVGGSKRHFPWSLIKSSGFFLRDVWFLYLRCRLRDASSRPDFRCLKIFGNLKWKAEWMKTKGVIKYKLGQHFKNYVLCLSGYDVPNESIFIWIKRFSSAVPKVSFPTFKMVQYQTKKISES